jgi:outer membrane protein assembly factor BamB
MVGIRTFPNLGKLVTRLRDDLNDADLVLLYAFNRTGKTRLSMEFKDAGKRKTKKNPAGTPDTLYFNAFTEPPSAERKVVLL